MTWYLILIIFIVFLGTISLAYQIYRLTELDARCRGLKHPKFWGFFSLSGNNGSGGLILYLIGRRKYPITISTSEQKEMSSRKQKAGVSLLFLAVGAIVLFAVLINSNF